MHAYLFNENYPGMISESFFFSAFRKLLVNDPPTVEDLEGIDYSLVKSMELLRTIETTGVNEETFSSTFFETFTTTSSDDRVVELKPNGKNIDVTFENRHEYCDLVIQVWFNCFLLNECLIHICLFSIDFTNSMLKHQPFEMD